MLQVLICGDKAEKKTKIKNFLYQTDTNLIFCRTNKKSENPKFIAFVI